MEYRANSHRSLLDRADLVQAHTRYTQDRRWEK